MSEHAMTALSATKPMEGVFRNLVSRQARGARRFKSAGVHTHAHPITQQADVVAAEENVAIVAGARVRKM
jgi:hypothetical protein